MTSSTAASLAPLPRPGHATGRRLTVALTLTQAYALAAVVGGAGCTPRLVVQQPPRPPPPMERAPPTSLEVLLAHRVELALTPAQAEQVEAARRRLDDALRPLESELRDLAASRGKRPEPQGEQDADEGSAGRARPQGQQGGPAGAGPGGGPGGSHRGGHGGGHGGRMVDPLAFGRRVEALLDRIADEDLGAYLALEGQLTPVQLLRARELVTEQRGEVQERREAIRRRLELTGA